MSRTISPEACQSMLGTPGVTVIDVRRKDDYDADQSVLPGSVWLDPSNIDSWSSTLPAGNEIVLYCVRGGAVSNSVVDTLQAKGLKAHFIEGGISAWKEAGGNVVKK